MLSASNHLPLRIGISFLTAAISGAIGAYLTRFLYMTFIYETVSEHHRDMIGDVYCASIAVLCLLNGFLLSYHGMMIKAIKVILVTFDILVVLYLLAVGIMGIDEFCITLLLCAAALCPVVALSLAAKHFAKHVSEI